jgi:hypothetical protein
MTDVLKPLIEQDNRVAAAIAELLDTPYGDSPTGFKLAIEDAITKYSDLRSQSIRDLPPILPGGNDTRYNHYSGYSRLIDQAGIAGQVWPGHIMGIPNRPSPLASMLLLGLIGAGAGRAIGSGVNRLAEGNVPKLKTWGTIGGAALGMLPGMFSAAVNASQGRDPLFGDLTAAPYRKMAMWGHPDTQAIPVDRVHAMVWQDPQVARRLPVTLAAATTAATEGASRVNPRRQESLFITPTDMGRMAVGLGGGYVSGLIAGRALGAIFGVPDSTQKVLRQSGAVAGLLRAVIPPMYGMM